LEAARDRPNLTIIGQATVDKVLFDGRKAIGVLAIVAGQVRKFEAPLVIVSAGAIHSPVILQRSGIGPAALLKRKDIEVLADLPVGEGFFDHPYCRIELKLKPGFKATDLDARHTNCCVRMSSGVPGAERDDILYVAMNHGGIGVESDSAQFGEAMVNLILMEAKSRGTVQLRSANPFDQPLVEENMLDDPMDLQRMRIAYRHLGEIARQAPIQAIAERVLLGDSDLPLSWLETASDEEVDNFLLAQSSDAQHGIGGCCMGRPGEAVVDPECRVYGLEGLRVIDASIMPLDCQANTNLTSIMIGEKMADSLRRST
ncbi:MAG: GMC family oxidoreductase, partial [Mesorhizobium sp.]